MAQKKKARDVSGPVDDKNKSEIVVTSEMRKAGAFVIQDFKNVVSSDALAEDVYIAMARLAPAN